MELGRHGHGYFLLLGQVENGIGHTWQREAQELVVAVDARALGNAVLVVWMYGLLICAVHLGEGIFVGARISSERRDVVLHVVLRD